jgi:Rad3-related DNA helicase
VSLSAKRRKELDGLIASVVHDQNYVMELSEELLRGKPEKVLLLKPLTVRDMKPWMWNYRVHKIVLMSATLSEWELYELGLDRRKVAHLDIDSSIPAANRPFLIRPVANMAYENRAHSTPLIAEHLLAALNSRRDKGVIHVTYDVAARLRGMLSHERLIWHSRGDRQEQYAKFRNSRDKVFVASGMSEGIDLAYDAARWQTICQVPYPNLGDSAIARKAELQPEWFQWEAVKTTLQTIGRVCRAPDDYGMTELIDSQGPDFLRRSWAHWPQHVRCSIKRISE